MIIDALILIALPFIGGYLLGSIPFGLIVTRLGGAGDVRSIGSGNIGATNVLRTGRKGLAAITLILDALKAAAAVWLAMFLFPPVTEPVAAAALGAFLGHLFPIWLKFRGGKGIAAYAGLLIALSLWGLLAFAVVWLLTAFLTRYSSLAALLATLAVPIAIYLTGPAWLALLFAVLTLIAWFKHRDNISRLLSRTESRIGAKG